MKDYRERRNCRWMKSLNDLVGRSGIMFSLRLRRQGKARLDRKVGGLEDTRECTSKTSKSTAEILRKQTSTIEVDGCTARAFLGLAASPKVWLREKNASQANATCESRAIL